MGERVDWRLFTRLSLMMFLEYAVWGAWSVMIALHMGNKLHFTGFQIGLVFGTTAFGAVLSPMIAGWVADRFLPSQVYTGLSHLVGAVLLYLAWQQTEFWPLWTVMFIYALAYMPTIALTNGIAFKHWKNTDWFGYIRVWGTIGWIVIQFVVGGYLKHAAATTAQSKAGDCLLFGAAVAVLMGIYSFTLPNTPPTKNVGNPYAFLEAFALAKNRNFLILLVISFVVAIELPWYYNLTPLFFQQAQTVDQAADRWLDQAREAAGNEGLAAPAEAPILADGVRFGTGGLGLDEGGTQFATTIGQLSEIAFMFLLFLMLTRIGMRKTIFIGILAWPLRYIAFSVGEPTWLVLASQALHGIGYTFFFAAGMVAVEKIAPKDIRASAQALMVFATNGCGMLVGHFLSGKIHDLNAVPILGDWSVAGRELVASVYFHFWPGVFALPIVVTIAAAVVFYIKFSEDKYRQDVASIEAAEAPGAAVTD